MKINNRLINYLKNKKINEGFDDEGNPDSKYYAFDWDDNILYMPTKIMVLTENDDVIGMSTEDFAKYRSQLGKTPFEYNGTTVVGYSSDPFVNFGVKGDKKFIIDSMMAQPGPSWNDFVECINGGSIFAIITARGHNPETIKESVLNFIASNHLGINNKTLSENLKKYRSFDNQSVNENIKINFNNKDLIEEYLNMCVFNPVSFGEGSASYPEKGKINALRSFIGYCKEMSKEIGNKSFFKNDVENNEIIPFIGFSDDDEKNIDSVKKFLKKEYDDSPVRTYLTKGGEKLEV